MHRLARFLLPLLVFAAGLAAGAWFSIDRRAADFSAGIGRRLAESAAATPAPARSDAHAFSSDEEMLTAIMSALVEEEPLLRAHRLHELLGGLGSAELGQLFRHAVQMESRERRGELLGALLARWAEADPAAAAAAVQPHRDRCRAAGQYGWRNLDGEICRAWAQAMPEAVLAEAAHAPDSAWASENAWAAIQTLGEGDPARQLAVLAGQPASRLQTTLAAWVIRVLSEKDPAAAEAALALLTDPRQRANMQVEILAKLTAHDPAAGLARLAALAPGLAPGAASTRLVGAILGAVAARDAAAALRAIDGLPEELRPQARSSVLVGWAGEHPLAALEWTKASGLEPSDVNALAYFGVNDFGWNSLVGTALERDRAGTLAWMRAQPGSPQRDAMLGAALQRGSSAPLAQRLEVFAALSPEGQARSTEWVILGLRAEGDDRAAAWIKGLPSCAARAAAVWQLAYYESYTAPDQLDTLAEAWPAGPDRDAALRGVAQKVSQIDSNRALDYVRRIGDPTAREAAFYRTANIWLGRDATAARAWLAATPEISAESKRVLLRQHDER